VDGRFRAVRLRRERTHPHHRLGRSCHCPDDSRALPRSRECQPGPEELARRGKITGVYVSKTGRTTGSKPFSRGHIYRILSNPLYVGDIEHKGVRHPGLHPAIIDRETFDAVQARLATNGHAHRARADASETSLLAGLIFRAEGTPLIATHAGKTGKRYRYYVSKQSAGGDAGKSPSRAFRISASEIEPLVVRQLAAFLTDEHRLVDELRGESDPTAVSSILTEARKLAVSLGTGSAGEQRAILSDIVERIAIGEQALRIELKRPALLRHLTNEIVIDDDGPPIAIDVPVSFTRRGVEARLIVDGPSGAADRAPDAALVKAVARAHVWFDELTSGRAGSIVEIAKREGVSDRFVSILLDLAFLAPSVVEAIVHGRQPASWTAKGLMFGEEIPVLWQTTRTMDAVSAGN
jgi:site-specific DNA recombinase